MEKKASASPAPAGEPISYGAAPANCPATDSLNATQCRESCRPRKHQPSPEPGGACVVAPPATKKGSARNREVPEASPFQTFAAVWGL